ncbi:substrate-binding periplasmic protein [Pseudomonas wenzhouensis]|uniref:substrate-binding periplasmic protein n=1 Tax=Pseudomonas wenzhouensis TaxID=2906062 RepID=UPI001E2CD4ED|nr:transporter substrate-binding domain-containing protein [Pseudomonas wenzhouensis]UFQ97154.1 transporter substrate-binding domain-containing protein [Pseudomonas wenzhouensis]
MAARLLALLLGMSVILTAHAELQPPDEIQVASEVWEGHTNADGTGMAWDILREVFEPVGVRLHVQSVPYTRAVGLVQRGSADAWVGSYRDEVDEGVLYPRWHYDGERVSALGLRGKPAPTLESLGELHLVWKRGYEYQRYLPNVRHYREVRQHSDILGMLDQGHADFHIDSHSELELLLANVARRGRYQLVELTWLPLYIGFADNVRGRALAELFDQRMALLVKAGTLRPIFARWQQPYPFD